MNYYVQHGAGLGGLVSRALKDDLRDVAIRYHDDSSAIVSTSALLREVRDLPYLKNVFEVLATVPRGEPSRGADQIAKLIRKRDLFRADQRGIPFRTMINIDGQLVGLPREVRARLESTIAERTGGRLNARGGTGTEYWVIGRRDLGQLLFCRKVTIGAKKAGARGSLSADLATLLVKASSPTREDVFLDPFGGSGSIVDARIKQPFRKAIYSDLDLAKLRSQLPPQLVQHRHVEIMAEDALVLASVDDASISSIVTDPPWGEHESLNLPLEEFFAGMLKTFDRVLDRERGRVVMLVARRVAADVASLWRGSDLQVHETHDILVNGHPATVLAGGRLKHRHGSRSDVAPG